MNAENGSTPFKICPLCKKIWLTRSDFLYDKEVSLVGYQAHFEELTEGLFLFNHVCLATMTLKAGLFKDLYDGPMFESRLTGTDECPGYCLVKKELKACPAKCECAYVREIIQLVLFWPKTNNHEPL